mgnify:CR=1 FL=1
MKLKNYLPLKAVVEDLGVSRWTLWRAAGSGIAGFPQPTKVGRQIYWKKSEIETLEAALLRFEGRCAFERKRNHEKKGPFAQTYSGRGGFQETRAKAGSAGSI